MNDRILLTLAEARAYLNFLDLHGDTIPSDRRNTVIGWVDKLLRDLATEVEGAG